MKTFVSMILFEEGFIRILSRSLVGGTHFELFLERAPACFDVILKYVNE